MSKRLTQFATGFAFAVLAGFSSYGLTQDDYAMKFTVTIADGVGDKTAKDAVIPIRLSETAINGFRYDDFAEADGTDLYIIDGDGEPLNYEIDMWNPSGETTVWVKVPNIAARTTLSVYYRGPKNDVNDPKAVWSLFLGVWHFNETSVNGTIANAYEATGNEALTGYDTPKTTSVDGFFGLARQPRATNDRGLNHGVGGVFLPAMTLNNDFVISGWFKVANPMQIPLFTTKGRYDDNGFNMLLRGRYTHVEMLGDNNGSAKNSGWNNVQTGISKGDEWHRYSIAHSSSNNKFSLYIDGASKGTASTADPVTDTGKEICVGNASCEESKSDANTMGCYWKNNSETGAGYSFIGQMDEIRIQSYEKFDANREYFEGAIAKDSALSIYSPAASCGSLVVGLSFEVIKRIAPGEIKFTATADGATGACTYSWDFNNDGTVDRVGTSAVETWECTTPGKYNAKVSVVDSIGVAGEITTLDTYIINGTFYIDGDAEADGEGSPESPFNSLRTLSVRMNDGDQALIRGTFIVGDEKEAINFAANDIAIDKWGDGKPLIKSTNTTFVATSGIFVFNGANTVVSNFVFNMTKESFSKANIVRFNGNNATLGQCDFSVVGGKCEYVWGFAGGVGTSAAQRGLLISDCTFKGFRDGDKEVFPLMICEDATVVRCLFEDVSCAIRAANGTGGNFNFVSNIVLNAESESVASSTAGVVIRGGWSYFSGSTIAYNRFINANEEQRAGCVIYCTSKTGQNGIYAHHNTVVGYKTFASFDNTGEPWTFMFSDNLIVGSDCLFKDTATTATYATQKDGYIRNNYYTGIFRDVPEGYAFDEAKMVVDGNVALTDAPRFVSTADPTDLDFYRPKVTNKKDVLRVGGWTNGGKYPAYIGAVLPAYTSGMAVFIR